MEEHRDWINQIGENDLTAQTQEKQKFKLGLGVFEIQSKFLTSIQICWKTFYCNIRKSEQKRFYIQFSMSYFESSWNFSLHNYNHHTL